MNINDSKDMTKNDFRKAGYLMTRAAHLGMDMTGYGFLDVNTRSGNVYLWLEDYNFTLFISPGSDTVKALYSCPIDGEETERIAGISLTRLQAWADKLAAKSDKKAG